MYFRVPIEVSTDRLLARRVKLKFYEAGMDMGWSTNARRELPHVPGQGAGGVRSARGGIRAERDARRAAASPISSGRSGSSCRSIWRSRTMMTSSTTQPEDGAPRRTRSRAATTATGSPTCRSTGIRARSSRSKAPTASAARRRSRSCASGSRSRATASSKRAGRARS